MDVECTFSPDWRGPGTPLACSYCWCTFGRVSASETSAWVVRQQQLMTEAPDIVCRLVPTRSELSRVSTTKATSVDTPSSD